MNEFVVHGENGRLVAVEKLVSRADGYYWPQAVARVSSVRDAMEFYVDQASFLTEHRFRARQYAEELLDWRRNGEYLLDCIAQVQKGPAAEMREMGKRAMDYEMSRATLPQKHPRLFYCLSLLRRPFKHLVSVTRSL
jgi:hypothetical protein